MERDNDGRIFTFLRARICAYFILASVALLLIVRSGIVPIWGSSEAREAHVAQLVADSLSSGTSDWILPLRNGLVPSKPPLLHWLASFLILTFGISGLWAARIISAGAALGTVLLVSGFCAKRAIWERSHSTWWLATGILLSSYGFFSMASDARVDMLLCFLVTGAGLSFLSGLERVDAALPASVPDETRRLQYRVALWCGLAVLAKGPLGVAFPGLIAVTVVAWKHRTLWTVLVPRVGPLVLFLLLAIPWYLFAAQRGGEQFVERQIFFENVSRLAGGEGINSKPWHYYLPVLISTAFPWSFVAISGVIAGLVGKRELPISAIVWIGGVVLLSCADGKRAAYLLLLLPWIAMHVSQEIGRFVAYPGNARMLDRWSRRALNVIVTVCLVAISISVVIHDQHHGAITQRAIQAGACLLVWIGIVSLLEFLQVTASPAVRFGGRLVSIAGIAICIASVGLAIKGELKGYEQIGAQLVTITHEKPLFAVRTRADERLDALFYQMQRPVTVIAPEVDLHALPHEGYLLAAQDWLLSHGFSAEEFLVVAPAREPDMALVRLARAAAL